MWWVRISVRSLPKRSFSTSARRLKEGENDFLLVNKLNGVTTLKMNRPKQLNGWTAPMMMAIRNNLKSLGTEENTKVVVLTGSDPYYCAGVNLSAMIKPMAPAKLFRLIVENNQALFDAFLDFPKPIMIAVNGPAIGACVTSATLCDGIIASEKATFCTPFHRLGVPPEGCSSVHFERLLGPINAQRMLGREGWTPTGKEAFEINLVQKVVPHEKLMEEAQKWAEEWIKAGKKRTINAGGSVEEYKKVNAKESIDLGHAFLSPPFLQGQIDFLTKKGKTGPAMLFKFVKLTRPIWIKTL